VLLGLILDIVMILLNVLWWIIIIQAVLSWLIAFNVINLHNNGLRQIIMTLDRMTAPIYRPVRRILPDFGGLDLSPLVILLVIGILQNAVIPRLYMMAMGA